jgi:hypothetical protein
MRIQPLPLAFLAILAILASLIATAGACGGTTRHDIAADTAATCQQLMDQYASAFPTASACVPGAADQCQQNAPLVECPNCGVRVQDPSTLEAIVTQLVSQGCVQADSCACPSGTPVITCIPTGGGAGTCATPLTN